MIDIHTHVLPGIDDGADGFDTALDLLEQAAASGVHTLVATPHCNIPGEFENYVSSDLEALFQRLDYEKDRNRIPIKLCRGMEVYATEELPDLLQQGRVWTLNGTTYFLTEFAFDEDPRFCRHILDSCISLGLRPVIAHPERYFFIQDDLQIAYTWCTHGCALQLNKGSILGRFGSGPKRAAMRLLDHGLIACVASDAHNPYHRTTHMTEVYQLLCSLYDEDYAELLLEENPARILRGDSLLGFEPLPFD